MTDHEHGIDDDHVRIGRQFGLFLRRADKFYADLRLGSGLDLERAAYTLLGRIVTDGPARLTVLAEDVSLDLSTVSRQVAALETAGLVARTTDLTDRRASVITATETGFEVFSRNREVWLRALRELLADWSPAERAEFARLFTRFNDTIGDRAAGGDAPRQETMP
jgi:DNA-binding MarR family transcriptional regulator